MPDPIVLVEDEPGVRSFIKTILTGAGYLVIEAADGTSAFHEIRERAGRIAALLTDIDMGRMGGVELAELIRSEYPFVPILFFSGLPIPPDNLERVAPGSGFLAKPFQAATLIEAVQKLVYGK